MDKYKNLNDEVKEKIAKMSIEEMQKINNFSVFQDTDEEDGCKGDGKWYLYESICKLGGCDYNGIPFMTEREALEEAVKRTLNGEEPDINYACPECYREYLNECI